MEWFNPHGHVSAQALAALQDGTLDEMARMEVAEHLGFCEECLLRYTTQLGEDALLAPARPAAPAVRRRLRLRRVQFGWLRYGTVAAAACMAVMLWGAGSHLLAPPTLATAPPAVTAPAPPQEDWRAHVRQLVPTAQPAAPTAPDAPAAPMPPEPAPPKTETSTRLLDWLPSTRTEARPADPAQPSNATREEDAFMEVWQRESLFDTGRGNTQPNSTQQD